MKSLMFMLCSVVALLAGCGPNTDWIYEYTKEDMERYPTHGSVESFVVSPDETKIAFVLKEHIVGKPYVRSKDIWVMDIDGSNKKRVTYTGYSKETLKAIELYENKPPFKIMYSRLDAEEPFFTPDGKHVGYREVRTDFDITNRGSIVKELRYVNLAGDSKFENLPYSGLKINMLAGAFSPDMTKYAYYKYKDKKYNFFVVDVKSNTETKIENDYWVTGYSPEINWHKDSRRLFFIARKKVSDQNPNGKDRELYMFSCNTEQLKKITWSSGGISGFVWADDFNSFIVKIGNHRVSKEFIEKNFNDKSYILDYLGYWEFNVEELTNSKHLQKDYFIRNFLYYSRNKKILYFGVNKKAYIEGTKRNENTGFYSVNHNGTIKRLSDEIKFSIARTNKNTNFIVFDSTNDDKTRTVKICDVKTTNIFDSNVRMNYYTDWDMLSTDQILFINYTLVKENIFSFGLDSKIMKNITNLKSER